MKTVTQRPISVKVDMITMGALDTECFNTGEKRNRVINDAIRFYLELRDARRTARAHGEDPMTSVVLKKRLEQWFAHWSN